MVSSLNDKYISQKDYMPNQNLPGIFTNNVCLIIEYKFLQLLDLLILDISVHTGGNNYIFVRIVNVN